MVRRMSPMKRHLNLRHTMNFMVLQGLVNQKKEVSGRLKVIEKIYILTTRSQLFLFDSSQDIFEANILGRVQFWVHVGFVPAFSCRSLIRLRFTYNLQCHLHLSLQGDHVTREKKCRKQDNRVKFL